MPHVIAQRNVCRYQTYDIEVIHPDHQFYLSNGLLTSNSHAVSYALDSYMCAWLLTYHESEWLCAYAEEYAADSDKKRARALSEIRSLGYVIVRPDVNHASGTWTILPGKRFMPSFNTIKSIGDAAVDEIMQCRPYRTVYDLLWSPDGTWKHSKFNKRVMENLIKVGAFESMDIIGDGKYFGSYRHMHHVIVENWARLKKKDGRRVIDELTASTRGLKDWTRDEKVAMYIQLVGALDVDLVVPSSTLARLGEKGITSIDDADEDVECIHWLVVVDVKVQKTKNGKLYARLTVVGAAGAQQMMNVWGYNAVKPIECYTAYLAEVSKNDWGLSTQAWKMRKIT
jgi:DNA polymerase III alpha subunit